MTDNRFTPLLVAEADRTIYRKLATEDDAVSVIPVGERHFLQVTPGALRQLAFEAYRDVSHFLRTAPSSDAGARTPTHSPTTKAIPSKDRNAFYPD